MLTSTSPGVQYDPFNREFNVDPYPVWKTLRDEYPLFHNQPFEFYALSRYADIQEARLDHQAYTSVHGAAPLERMYDPEAPRQMLIEQDPPDHSLFRKITNRSFTPKAIAQLEAQVRALCVEFMEPLTGGEPFDFVQDFARHIPMMATCFLLGIDRPDQDEFRALFAERERAMLDVVEPDQYANVIACEERIKSRLLDVARARRSEPRDDVISALVHASIDDPQVGARPLSEYELGEYCLILFNGGNSTTTLLMGWIASVLARFPAARQELRERPDLIRGAIEEILRFEPVSHVQGRVATRDVTWHGQVVPAGSKVFLLTGAACRDERRYEAPDTFDIHRKVGTHMAFGWGIHTCIGAHLARLEGRIATEELLARVPDWSVDYSRAEMRIISSMRGYLRLPLTF